MVFYLMQSGIITRFFGLERVTVNRCKRSESAWVYGERIRVGNSGIKQSLAIQGLGENLKV